MNNRIEEDRNLFGQLLVISKDRSVDFEQLFTYELSSIPQAIENIDGHLAKTNKAQTLHDLEANVQPLDHDKLMQVIRKLSTAVFVDHMACVQKLKGLCHYNVNTENQWKTCLKNWHLCGTYKFS